MRRRIATALLVTAMAFALGACATVHNVPLNAPSANPLANFVGTAIAEEAAAAKQQGDAGGRVIGLAFSGGGTRAAAFAYGVLTQLQNTPVKGRAQRDMLDEVGVVSGVSGGSVMAAYYALKGRAGLADFRQRFLTQDVMAQLNTRVSLVNIDRALGGGANTDEPLRNWFNANLFDHATFGTVIARRRPIMLINATNVYSRTPFVFSPQTFAAMCSDITEYPLAEGVAASAAVPGVFAPIVLKSYSGECKTPLAPWIVKAANNPTGSPLLHAYAKSLEQVHNGQIKYVKLFDGGMVDNYGLSGMTIARASAHTPYGPLRPEEAFNLRRLMVLVVDAGRGPGGDWSQTVEGPTGKQLVSAVFDAIIDANSRSSYAAFAATMKNWRDAIVRWRCHLKPAQVARLRGKRGRWNCHDLKITVGRVAFDVLGAARAKQLDAVPTSFTLPAATVDQVVQAGRDALKLNPEFQAFARGK